MAATRGNAPAKTNEHTLLPNKQVKAESAEFIRNACRKINKRPQRQ